MSLVDLSSLSGYELERATVEDAKEYKRIRARTSMFKGTRPWSLVDVTEDLDPSQPWIGMEWENGFTSLEKYQQVIDFVWAAYHGVTVDAEGPGPWFGEFTFSPTNLSDFNAETVPFFGLLNYMHDNGIRMPLSGYDLEEDGDDWEDPDPDPVHGARPSPTAYWCSGCDEWHGDGSPVEEYRDSEDLRDGWGIHVNISMPEMRDATYVEVEVVGYCMNAALQRLNYEERLTFFGRDPYGWCYTVGGGGRYWWEFKLFHTTDDKGAIAGYKTVINGLVQMLDIFIKDREATISKTDMKRMLSGTYTSDEV